jgi:hypothetical protein
MKITIESTSKIVELNGVPARIWEGTTDTGVQVHCFVTRIAVHEDANEFDVSQFERELMEQKPPSATVYAFPLSMIL